MGESMTESSSNIEVPSDHTTRRTVVKAAAWAAPVVAAAVAVPIVSATVEPPEATSIGATTTSPQVGNVGRSVSYSLYPSEIVDRVVVHKTSEAKLVEGGTAGSVNIITRRPLQFAEPLTIQGSIGAVHSDLPGDTKPQLDALPPARAPSPPPSTSRWMPSGMPVTR